MRSLPRLKIPPRGSRCAAWACGLWLVSMAAIASAQAPAATLRPGKAAAQPAAAQPAAAQPAVAPPAGGIGPSKAISPRPVDAVPYTPAQEELYLVIAADRFLSQTSKLAELPPTAPEVRQFIERCVRLRDYARQRKYDPAVATRFDELPSIVERMGKEFALRTAAVKQVTAKVREAIRQQRKNKERNQIEMIGGLGLFLLGSLPTYTNVRDPYTGTTVAVETGTLSPDISSFGLDSFLGGLAAEMSNQSQLEAARSVADEALRKLLEGSLKRDAESLAACRGALEKLYAARMQGEQPPRLPLPGERGDGGASKEPGAGQGADTGQEKNMADEGLKKVEDAPGEAIGLQDIIRQRQAKKTAVNPNVEARRRETLNKQHMEQMLKAQDARCATLRRHLGKHEPFSAAALVSLKGMLQTPADKRIEQWFQDGERIAKMAGFLPAGQAFDGERAELLGIASDLILRSAQLEAGPRSWKGIASEKAAAALPILEAALRFDPNDRAGVLREQQALACCLSGQVARGYQLAGTLRTLRGESQRFRFLMARAAFLTGHPEESIAELEVGIERLGMTDITPTRNCPDLPRDLPRFRELTTVQVEAQSRSGFSGGGTVVVVNRSLFPLTNVRAQLSHPTRMGRKTTEAFVPLLPPGEECEVPYDAYYVNDTGLGSKKKPDQGTIVVLTSQGRGTATVK